MTILKNVNVIMCSDAYTPHMKLCSDDHNKVMTQGMEMCLDSHTRSETAHMKMCSGVNDRVETSHIKVFSDVHIVKMCAYVPTKMGTLHTYIEGSGDTTQH